MLFFALLLVLVCSASVVDSAIYAVIISGAPGPDDGCHGNIAQELEAARYNYLLLQRGVPKENIVVMMNGEDIYSETCYPWPGHFYDDDSLKVDLLPDLRIDYNGSDVHKENLYAILTGNKSATSGGSGRVLESGPDDYVFVYQGGHGSNEWIQMVHHGMLARHLRPILHESLELKKFKQLLYVMDSCQSGSMFAAYGDPTDPIYMITATDPNSGSVIDNCYVRHGTNKNMSICDQTTFNRYFKRFLKSSNPNDTLFDEFQYLRDELWGTKKGSGHFPVSEYGQLSINKEPLSTFFGNAPSSPQDLDFEENELSNDDDDVKKFKIPNGPMAPYLMMKKQLGLDPELSNDEEFMASLGRMEQRRSSIQKMTKSIVQSTMAKSQYKYSNLEMILNEKPVGVENSDCYQNVLELVFDECPEVRKSPFIEDLLNPIIHLCNQNHDESQLMELVKKECY